MDRAELISRVAHLLGWSAMVSQPSGVQVTVLVPDGSSRRFFQLQAPGEQPVIAILPPEGDGHGHAEARSFDRIGRHLHQTMVPVPKVLGFDADSGLVCCEDLGRQRLFEVVTTRGLKSALPYYEAVIRELVHMQVCGAEGFDPDWCWDTPCYDQRLMRERESGYFLQACCTDFLGIQYDHEAVAMECAHLADQAAQAPARFFLHRDFQCRNIMLTGGNIRFIDFQGGRLGPLAYDLASLLLDPYAALPETLQEHLLDVYLHVLRDYMVYDPQQFRREYVFLALQRNLQILGAFAFLSQVRQKPFFTQFLQPALFSLRRLLAKPEAASYVVLNSLAGQCHQELSKRL